ncbi:MAG: PIG-L family deacetylase [Anaerolineales bacterium]|nr:PIG-L family deacetylase [Anaerolineales bacterium]
MKILCVTAHPDDESVFAGGTLALLAGRGAEAGILCCTRGEGGEAGEPPLCTRAELGTVRTEELRCAARALGCAAVDFLPFRDPDVGPDNALHAFAGSAEEVMARMMDYFTAAKPDAVITHGSSGEYGHPGHRLAHRACVEAARRSGVPVLYSFSADHADHPRKQSANRNDPADFVVEIGPAFEQKLAAMACHRTQIALFVRKASADAGRPVPLRDVIRRLESFHRVFPRDPKPSDGRDIVALLGEFLAPLRRDGEA